MALPFLHWHGAIITRWNVTSSLLIFQDSKYTAVSGFLFLRFFAPAILGPKLFGLRENHADKNVSRTLTILAKVSIWG